MLALLLLNNYAHDSSLDSLSGFGPVYHTRPSRLTGKADLSCSAWYGHWRL